MRGDGAIVRGRLEAPPPGSSMTENTTGAMQQVGGYHSPTDRDDGSNPGFVLLYATEHLELPGAWVFPGKKVVIGRDPTVDLFLPVQAVSRIHAEVTWSSGQFVIRDLGSRNGVFVDGRPTSEAVLEPLTEVRIGDALLKFVASEAESYVPYRIDGRMSPGFQRRVSQTNLVGGRQMDQVASELQRIAPTPLSVILLGESGTGKEVAAREIHERSGRTGPFLAVNCAAIPATLLESELFGYRKGAFSGAERDKPGWIRLAHEGTLLLDEIGDMPLEAQAKLLRVLQSREVFPLGATSPERVDVRIVCATHRDLKRLIQAGKFREDLYARLDEYQLRLSPLRDRKEDLHLLARTFLARHGRPDLGLSFGYLLGLTHHDWPYNVRELEACVKRSIALADGLVLSESLLPESIQEAMSDYGKPTSPTGASGPPDGAQRSMPRPMGRSIPTDAELRSLLEQHRGNVAAIGRELGKARMQVHRWMQRYGIEVDDYR